MQCGWRSEQREEWFDLRRQWDWIENIFGRFLWTPIQTKVNSPFSFEMCMFHSCYLFTLFSCILSHVWRQSCFSHFPIIYLDLDYFEHKTGNPTTHGKWKSAHAFWFDYYNLFSIQKFHDHFYLRRIIDVMLINDVQLDLYLVSNLNCLKTSQNVKSDENYFEWIILHAILCCMGFSCNLLTVPVVCLRCGFNRCLVPSAIFMGLHHGHVLMMMLMYWIVCIWRLRRWWRRYCNWRQMMHIMNRLTVCTWFKLR